MDKTLVERIITWNKDRNGLAFDPSLEIKMLSEEANEFFMATGDVPHMLCEYADFLFVATGTKAKYYSQPIESITMFQVGYAGWKEMLKWIEEVEERMEMILNDICVSYDIGDVLNIVVTCNELKPKKKVDGKVVKGENHVDPVAQVRELMAKRSIWL